MPTISCVYKCHKRSSKDSDVLFCRFPQVRKRFSTELQELFKKRRAAWLEALRRNNISDWELNTIRICSNHFISGTLVYIINLLLNSIE